MFHSENPETSEELLRKNGVERRKGKKERENLVIDRDIGKDGHVIDMFYSIF